jgi:uroporphyrinogen-III decarboxylase
MLAATALLPCLAVAAPLRIAVHPDQAYSINGHTEVQRNLFGLSAYEGATLPAVPEAREVQRILASGVVEGGRFILRDANNLAPGTPPESVAVMYEACKEFGRYE